MAQVQAAITGLALALAALTAGAQAEVRVGIAAPLTGRVAWLGEQVQRAAELAAADINDAGGVLDQQISLIYADDNCEPEQAIAAARKLVAYRVAAVIGHNCSGAAIPASEVYAETGVLMISNAATHPTLTERGLRNVFRVVGRDDQQGMIAGDYLAERWGDKRIAIVHDGQAYGAGLAEETRRRLNARGVREPMFETVMPGQPDYSVLVARLKEANVEVLYFGGYAPEAGLILRQAHEAGLKIQLVAGDGIGSEDFGLIAGPAGEGTLITSFPDPRGFPAAAAVVERLRSEGFEPLGGTLYQYGAMQAWANATERAGSLKLEAVARILREDEFDTVLGRISFDEKGDVVGAEAFGWFVWRNGEFVPNE